MTKAEITDIIYSSIDDINDQNSSDIRKETTTELFGTSSEIDSLALVHLITTVEEKLEEKTGKYIPIADENAMSMEHSPFKTVDTLASYIETLV